MKCKNCKTVECSHKNLKYCECCKKVFCEDCNKEWFEQMVTWTYTDTWTDGSYKITTDSNTCDSHNCCN